MVTTANALSPFAQMAKNLNSFGIGHESFFDRLFEVSEEVERSTKYPPYNIVKEGENNFAIEIAIAGFEKDQLTIEQDGDKITVKGEIGSVDDDFTEYLYHGIAKRPFTRVFTLADHVALKGADIVNGLLTIQLERKIPEELMPKLIPIG